jgi:hypothetical protein
VILDAAPTPAAAATLTVAELAALLRAAGRQRGIAAEADKLHAVLSSEQMRQPSTVEQEMGLHLQGLLRQLEERATSGDQSATRAPLRSAVRLVTLAPSYGL